MSDFTVAFGKRIKHHRALHGKTQAQLGLALGISFQQVQKYEAGINRLSVEMLMPLCRFLEVAPATLLADCVLSVPNLELGAQDLVLYSALQQCSVRQKRAVVEFLTAFAGSA